MDIKKIIIISFLPLILFGSNIQAEEKKVDKNAGGKALRWEIIQALKAEKLQMQWIAQLYKGNPLLKQKHLGKFQQGLKHEVKIKIGNN